MLVSLYRKFLEGLKGYPLEVVELQHMLRRSDVKAGDL